MKALIKFKIKKLLLVGILLFISQSYFCQTPTWTIVSSPAPNPSGGLMLLLSDGSIICKTTSGGNGPFGNMWNKLTPDISGSYLNGTWSNIAPMNDTRLYFSSQILKDGRLYLAGGEYGSGYHSAEMYDPITNTWSYLSVPVTSNFIGDANSAILDNGNILQADLTGSSWNRTLIFNPTTNTFTAGPNCIGAHAESTWIKLPDNSILFADLNSLNTERYIPAINTWTPDASVPVSLYGSFGSETGPAMLLPNGKVFFLGSFGNSAIYTPSGNSSPGSWAVGPTLPNNHGCPDTQAAMKVDGKIIFIAGPKPVSTNSVYLTPTFFYEYDYLLNSFTQLTAPSGSVALLDSAFNVNMLNLPDGNIMMSQVGSNNYYLHKPSGSPLAAGKPTITAVTQNTCTSTCTLTGLLLNGISEGASFGDDWQMNTNFPIVRLTSGSNVYYARTHHWNHTGVQTGSLQDTTLFDLPNNLPNGTYSLQVVANGISSNPMSFTFNPFPALISPLIAPSVCSGNTFSYSAVANNTNTSFSWTRPAVAGISNPAISTPQTSNPNESLINTTNQPLTVVYSYSLSNGGCINYNQVSVVVGSNQSAAITGNTTTCSNKTATLTALGLSNYLWSNSLTTNSITVNPASTTVYSVSGNNALGCLCTANFTLNVKPSPTVSIAGNTLICLGDSVLLQANATGSVNYYNWDDGTISSSISFFPLITASYSVTAHASNGCLQLSSITVSVISCTGVNEINTDERNFVIYPNPATGVVKMNYNATGTCTLKVFNIIGEEVYHKTYTSGINEYLSLQNFGTGIYTFSISDENKNTVTKKIVINR